MPREPEYKDPHLDVSGALHDVSNALTVMLGWIGEARAAGASKEAVQTALRIVEQRARSARAVARRAIGGDDSASGMDGPCTNAVAEAVEALSVVAQRAGTRIVSTGDAESARARVQSPADVSQVLTNLLLNAVTYAPAGSEIRVAIVTGERDVTIDVNDEGPGVPEARRTSIFEGDTTREGGTGVGLRHARAIAHAAGGDLQLATIERGASFRVTWPRSDVMPALPRSVPRMQVFAGTRVLLIEDDAHVTQLLEAALVARGALVTIARNATEVDAAIASGPHDAVLLDLSPIAADPNSAFTRLRAGSPDATLVVISGSAEELPEAMNRAPVLFVRKPFEVGEIVAAIAAGRLNRG